MWKKTESEVRPRENGEHNLIFTLSIDYYLARPYNFYLTPLEGDGIDLKLERNFEFSASACGFLYKNKFDFGKVFSQGVPYLSRYEEAGIRKREEQRANQTATIPDVVLNPGSPELEFYRAARTKISTWVHDPKVRYPMKLV